MVLKDLVDVASYGTEYKLYVNNCFKGSYMGADKIPDEWLSYVVTDVGALSYELEVNLKEDNLLWGL